MLEIRWHGRGGQGVVTVSDMLAKSAILEDKYAIHIPEFGPERSGAPVKAYTRIDTEPIEIHSGVYGPDIVVVIDPMLAKDVAMITEGIKKGGIIVINGSAPSQDLIKFSRENNIKLYYVDAYRIAMDVFKRAFYNTPMLGALVKATGVVKLDSVFEVAKVRFKGELVNKNIDAIKRAYSEVKKYE